MVLKKYKSIANIKKLNFKNKDLLLLDFDAIDLYLAAMADFESSYRKSGSGFANTTDINGDLVNSFNSQSFTEGSANLGLKNFLCRK